VTSLNVDPVGYWPSTARLSCGRRLERRVLGRGQRVGVDRRVEARDRAHREDLAVARVERDERPGGPGVAVALGEPLADGHRAVALLLEGEVERELELAAGDRLGRDQRLAARQAGRVDLDPVDAVGPAQELVVGVLDAALTDHAGLRHAGKARLLELTRGDRADVAEQLGGHLAERVGPQVDAGQLHARELLGALGQRHQGPPVGVDLDRDGGVREVLRAVDDLSDRRRRHPEEAAEALVEGGPSGRAGREQALVDLDGDGLAAGDDRLVVAIEDRPARRLDRDVADPVGVGQLDVLRAGEDLQVPEPEEDDGKEDEREAAERGDADRELGREGHVTVAGGIDHRREIGLSPPVA
jgi:hypothetical protein